MAQASAGTTRAEGPEEQAKPSAEIRQLVKEFGRERAVYSLNMTIS